MLTLERRKTRATIRSILLGRQIQRTHPQIADYFLAGKGYQDILEEDPSISLGNTYLVVVSGMHYALAGHEGGFGIDPYPGLLSPDELKRASLEHRRRTGQRGYRIRIGAHARTLQERISDGHEAAKANGFTPWYPEALNLAYQLSQNPKYRRGKYVRAQLIADEVNYNCYPGEPVRTAKAVSLALARLKKRQKALQ